jgi:hypothetical protein
MEAGYGNFDKFHPENDRLTTTETNRVDNTKQADIETALEQGLAPDHHLNPAAVGPTTAAYLFSGSVAERVQDAGHNMKEKAHHAVKKVKQKLA